MRINITRLFRFSSLSNFLIRAKLFFIACAVGFVVTVVLVNIFAEKIFQYNNKKLVQEALENVAIDPRYAEIYRKINHLPNNTVYILLWNSAKFTPFNDLGNGQRAFVENNCSVINCFVTEDKNFFGGELNRFHAIAFNGRNINHYSKRNLPRMRSPHQKYIFFNMESSDNYPICSEIFDNFFNWTATYKLDSDIPFPYIQIKDKNGNVVGPKRNMTWETNMTSTDDERLMDKLRNKTEAAAWFVSHCSTRSRRSELVKQLQKYLSVYGLNLDVYGKCGPKSCPIKNQSKCEAILDQNYYFYMSLENSFAEDYVTEKLLTALRGYTIPIVYGGANYSRFLPPNSYLNAKDLSPEKLVATMLRLIRSPSLYSEYFRWTSYYSYHNPYIESVCSVCKALNDPQLYRTHSVYKHFRLWWNPEYGQFCKK